MIVVSRSFLLWLFGLAYLLLFSFGFVAAEDVLHSNTTLFAPSFFLLNHSQNNLTHVFPLNCLLDNGSNSSCPSFSRCEVERTLNAGETYIKEDDVCDLRFACDECSCDNFENLTHFVRWRVERDGEWVRITYLNENDTRSYRLSDLPSFEAEYAVNCPDLQGFGNEASEWEPVNITKDQFYWYCLEPFGEFGNVLKDLTFSNNEFQGKLAGDLSAALESNKVLAEENGRLKQQILDYDSCRADLLNCEGDHESLRESLAGCETELVEVVSKEGVKSFVFWFVIIVDVLALVVAGMWYIFKHFSGFGGDV